MYVEGVTTGGQLLLTVPERTEVDGGGRGWTRCKSRHRHHSWLRSSGERDRVGVDTQRECLGVGGSLYQKVVVLRDSNPKYRIIPPGSPLRVGSGSYINKNVDEDGPLTPQTTSGGGTTGFPYPFVGVSSVCSLRSHGSGCTSTKGLVSLKHDHFLSPRDPMPDSDQRRARMSRPITTGILDIPEKKSRRIDSSPTGVR